MHVMWQVCSHSHPLITAVVAPCSHPMSSCLWRWLGVLLLHCCLWWLPMWLCSHPCPPSLSVVLVLVVLPLSSLSLVVLTLSSGIFLSSRCWLVSPLLSPAVPIIPIPLLPVPTPQAVAHSSGWGCCGDGCHHHCHLWSSLVVVSSLSVVVIAFSLPSLHCHPCPSVVLCHHCPHHHHLVILFAIQLSSLVGGDAGGGGGGGGIWLVCIGWESVVMWQFYRCLPWVLHCMNLPAPL